jgi:hypothetical protein
LWFGAPVPRTSALALLLLLSACATEVPTSVPTPTETVTQPPSQTPKPSHAPTTKTAAPSAARTTKAPVAATTARVRLRLLVVTPRPRPASDYRRDAFGSSWEDTDGNGCNQRDDVLLRDAVTGSVKVGRQGSCDHDVLAGTWIDPYSGRKHVQTNMKDISQAEAVQIDHIVPLGEAWLSGARGWSAQRREAFANDLGELLAVDGPTNASKGDSDPAAWRPRKGYQCRYALRWIGIKYKWKLRVDPSEVSALKQMLAYC